MMDQKIKCFGKCFPTVLRPLNLQDNVLYAVECQVCGFHTLFAKNRKFRGRKFLDFVMLGEQKPLNLPVVIDPSFLEEARKYKGLYDVPDMSKELSKERQMEVLYEAVADGDITLDQFNRFSSRII